jgi:hypothetical protein
MLIKKNIIDKKIDLDKCFILSPYYYQCRFLKTPLPQGGAGGGRKIRLTAKPCFPLPCPLPPGEGDFLLKETALLLLSRILHKPELFSGS